MTGLSDFGGEFPQVQPRNVSVPYAPFAGVHVDVRRDIEDLITHNIDQLAAVPGALLWARLRWNEGAERSAERGEDPASLVDVPTGLVRDHLDDALVSSVPWRPEALISVPPPMCTPRERVAAFLARLQNKAEMYAVGLLEAASESISDDVDAPRGEAYRSSASTLLQQQLADLWSLPDAGSRVRGRTVDGVATRGLPPGRGAFTQLSALAAAVADLALDPQPGPAAEAAARRAMAVGWQPPRGLSPAAGVVSVARKARPQTGASAEEMTRATVGRMWQEFTASAVRPAVTQMQRVSDQAVTRYGFPDGVAPSFGTEGDRHSRAAQRVLLRQQQLPNTGVVQHDRRGAS